MVLAKLTCGITQRLQQFRSRRVFGLETDWRAWQSDFGETGPETALTGNERSSARSTALLTIGIGKHHAFLGEAINVRSVVTFYPAAIAAAVVDADIIAPDDEDVRLLGHFFYFVAHVTGLLFLPCSSVNCQLNAFSDGLGYRAGGPVP